VWGETYDLSGGVKTNWDVHYGREFRYDGARERYLVRELDPEPLKTGGISSLKDTWTDYDGDEPYTQYTVTQGTPDVAVPKRSFELGIGTFEWGDDGLGNILPVATSAKMFHMDHLGTTRHMSDSAGAAGESSVYTAFGMLRSGTAHGYGYDGAWGYQSNLADTATSGGSGDPVTDPRLGFPFLHVGHRYYDPSTGRFLQRDPIGIDAGTNVYLYANGVPTASADPDGLFVRPLLKLLGKLLRKGPKKAPPAKSPPPKAPPKPSPKFKKPTNPPQNPPKDPPPGTRVREGKPTEQYPDGYWRMEKLQKDGTWQYVNPSTMKPGPHCDTHVPLPPRG
jgi:RHS repeat-associated protein